MASEDRRSCPIFRIERGTFQESNQRALNCDYPLVNEDEDVFLRVTKLSSPNNSPLSLTKKFTNNGRNSLINSTTNDYPQQDSWDDTGRSLHENTNGPLHSLSDDYVFL